ncbi:MAG: FAD-binding protein [Corynebacteriales bacterium]|nr:FAD-binding protein [Mycobacteriales bacterium]
MEESLRYSLMPPVTPYGGELGFLSVGGVLATGGANSRSVTYGLMSDNVARLEVVTGAGETLTCSPSDRADLFFAALGGYGQSAIITQATLELIPAPKNVRVYWLFHHTMQEAIHALRSALAEGIWDQADVLGYQHSYTDAIRAPSPRDGELINTLRLTAFHRESPPDDEALLRNFRSHFSIRIEDVSFRDSLLKKRAFYDLLDREKVRMQGPHRGVAIPDDNMEAFLSALLEKFPLDRVGPYWHVHCVPISGPVGLQTPLFRLPAAESWGVVCPWLGMAQEHSPQASRDLYQLALDNGGMLLGGLTGWPMLPDDWKAYFGPAWNELQRAKHKYDPNNVLQSLTNTG